MSLATSPAPRRIAVFRALALGDLLVAVPALRALRRRYPRSHLTLIGLPWARELAARFPWIDQFMAFPGHPGLPELQPGNDELPSFFSRARAACFDLALQLHGSGELTNSLVFALGARVTAGFYRRGQHCPDPALFLEWPETGHETVRLLALLEHLGVPRAGLHLEWPVAQDDEARLDACWEGARRAERLVCVHPGARLASRRWPVERFAAVADALAERGWQVVITGSAAERGLAQALKASCRAPLADLTGRTDLGTLAALVSRARLVIANDTGISHVAAALRTPSVIVSCGADPLRFAPLDRRRHAVLSHDVPCRPCQHDLCPVGHECASGVPVEAVVHAALRLLETEHAHVS